MVLVVQLRGIVALTGRLVSARLAIATAAIAQRPAGDWASCWVGAAAIAGSLSAPLPVRTALAGRATRLRGALAPVLRPG